jgi:hypothetical protein
MTSAMIAITSREPRLQAACATRHSRVCSSTIVKTLKPVPELVWSCMKSQLQTWLGWVTFWALRYRWPKSAGLALALTDLEAALRADAPHPLGVHAGAGPAQERRDPAVAVAGVPLAELHDA